MSSPCNGFLVFMTSEAWDDFSKGMFFLLAGGIAVAVGIVFEHRAKGIRLENER